MGPRPSIELVAGLLLGMALSSSLMSLWTWMMPTRSNDDSEHDLKTTQGRRDEIANGVPDIIGNTPLIRIRSLSQALGVDILGKAEFLNPGGSVKDRVAMKMIDDAEFANLLKPGTNSRIFEGTVGSTGISIATLAAARYDPITI
ncbi:hypothetical protein FRC19_006561 [Serendipita sp. 401]|nr:hypothetical protein FRC16_004505 [Serendipita sp. 398]KAG8826937.1 hypothetical protein FRC19_006561 [Serendipita sp. 401]KAG8836311.1 hypothetical protein FRC18_011598 [Serendipita sp. 400]